MNKTLWTVIGEASFTHHLCRCACGTVKPVNRQNFKYGSSKSCGCLRSEKTGARFRKHGHSRDHVTGGQFAGEYSAWMSMKKRCRGTAGNDNTAKRYRDRGIRVCARWLDVDTGFENFLADLGPKPDPKLSLDRIDNDLGYWCGKSECPECGPVTREPNCRWATRRTQRLNCSRINMITVDGVPLCQKRLGHSP